MSLPPHIRALEDESIFILREVVAECNRPVLLYSIGKDSSALLHLARKAYHPAPIPYPLLHIDTTWKFREMIRFRDQVVQRHGLQLLVHTSEEGRAANISPVTHSSAHYTDVMKTQALRQALDSHAFDAIIGGARRDEEASRAKERVFSHRAPGHRWDPRRQRPELWSLYNTQLGPNETLRIFPLSNWTEIDIWRYIDHEKIPVVPLYFAQERPVVERNGMLIMVDDGRLPLRPGETPAMRRIRFRTLGCYPLTGAIESEASTIAEIISELQQMRVSERHGRAIDHDQISSMERKKREGYF